jgi:tetratricopeptide (TPR) repeat protein
MRAPRSGWVTKLGGAALLLAGLLLAIVASRAMLAGRQPSSAGEPQFVGSASCAGCHRVEHGAWLASQHGRAMQPATEATVRGDFQETTFAYAGVASRFFQRDGRYLVATDGPDGRLAEYEVAYTFGLEPLQQYLVPLAGGRLQALSIAWDAREAAAGGQRWLHLYPDERVDFRDELHWTKGSQNWNFMCADCHSTDVRKGYDAASGTFATAWSEVAVGCEACHGPGSAHLAWAESRDEADPTSGLTAVLDERRGVVWEIEPATGSAAWNRRPRENREIEVCAQCHARRAQIAEGYRAGQPFLDHYLPALLTPPLYHADGQQREEVYVWGSFLQSKMYEAGVTCADCHEPHAASLRAEGNLLCARCHAPAKYDARDHHFHDPASAAGRCVACHMTATTYMVVDPRRDHSFRVPRPDRSVALGVPNACTGCHQEHGTEWAAEAFRRWYGEGGGGFQDFAEAFGAGEAAAPGAGRALAAIAGDPARPAIVRASALERLALLSEPATVQAAEHAARDPSALVRLAAVRLAETVPAAERAAIAAPLLTDPRRAVRIESARVLTAAVGAGRLPAGHRPAWEAAAAEYLATLDYNADRPEARTALGTFRADLGAFEEAQQAFASARALDPDFVPAYLNAADAYRVQDREEEAQSLLEEGLARAPQSAPLHHALGLLHARRQRPELALRELAAASELAPEDRRFAYVEAVALHSFGRTEAAIQALERAAGHWPADRDVLVALATIQRDAGRMEAARRAAQALADAYPDDPGARALLDSMR